MKGKIPFFCAVAATSCPAMSNFVVNGDFESPSGGGQSTSLGTLAGWSASTDVVKIVNGNSIGVTGHSNDQVLDLGGTLGFSVGAKATVFQDVVLPVGTGTLSFRYGQRQGDTVNSNYLSAILTGAGGTLWAGNFSPYPPDGPLTLYSSPITVASPGTYRLSFIDQGYTNPGKGIVVDDVQLDVVPEPLSLVTLGLSAFALVGRRRRGQR